MFDNRFKFLNMFDRISLRFCTILSRDSILNVQLLLVKSTDLSDTLTKYYTHTDRTILTK